MPIYKQPNGGYLVKVSYKDNDGKYKKLTRCNAETRTKAGAMKVEAQLITEMSKSPSERLADREAKILEAMTFEMLADDFIEHSKHEKRKSTLRQCEQQLRIYLLPFFGKHLINDFTPSLIQTWKHKMDEVMIEKTKQPLSVTYKNTSYKVLSAILNYAAKYYGYTNNSHKRVGRFSDTQTFNEDKEIHYWSYEQFKAFSTALRAQCELANQNEDGNRLRYWGEYVLFNILFFCGLRKGEAYPLHWTDIKQKPGYYVLSITKSLAQKSGYDITPPKNKSSVREIPICNELLKILTEHYNRHLKVYGFDPKDPMWFISGGLNPISDTTIENTKNEIAKELGLPQIRIHDFRHSFVTMLINSDVNIKTISKLVGHSTVDQTWNTYGHLYPDKENEAIQLINKITQN